MEAHRSLLCIRKLAFRAKINILAQHISNRYSPASRKNSTKISTTKAPCSDENIATFTLLNETTSSENDSETTRNEAKRPGKREIRLAAKGPQTIYQRPTV